MQVPKSASPPCSLGRPSRIGRVGEVLQWRLSPGVYPGQTALDGGDRIWPTEARSSGSTPNCSRTVTDRPIVALCSSPYERWTTEDCSPDRIIADRSVHLFRLSLNRTIATLDSEFWRPTNRPYLSPLYRCRVEWLVDGGRPGASPGGAGRTREGTRQPSILSRMSGYCRCSADALKCNFFLTFS